MDFISATDRAPMSVDAWNVLTAEMIVSVTDVRAGSFESTRFRNFAYAADGDKTDRQTYNHCVPYQRLRRAIENKVANHTRMGMWFWLEGSLNSLYGPVSTVPMAQLSPPPELGLTITDSLTRIQNLKTRA